MTALLLLSGAGLENNGHTSLSSIVEPSVMGGELLGVQESEAHGSADHQSYVQLRGRGQGTASQRQLHSFLKAACCAGIHLPNRPESLQRAPEWT